MRKEINILIAMMLLLVVSTGIVCAATSKVMITLGNGWTSQYYKALPIMNGNNQPGVAFLITSEVPNGTGTVGKHYMNLSQVSTLYSAGWDLSSHTIIYPHFALLNTNDLDTELSVSKTRFNNSGFTRASNFLAYPYGKFEMQTLMTYGMAAYGYSTTPPSYIKDEINKSVAKGGLLVLSFHNIVDSGVVAPEDYLTSDFKEVSDFLRNKQDAGELDVVTISGYFYPPKITKTYEYTITNNMGMVALNELVGWELTAVIQVDSSSPREFYLKREIK